LIQRRGFEKGYFQVSVSAACGHQVRNIPILSGLCRESLADENTETDFLMLQTLLKTKVPGLKKVQNMHQNTGFVHFFH